VSAQKEFQKLKVLSDIPKENPAAWLDAAEDGIEFLKQNAFSDYVVLYASMPHVLIHAVLVPLNAVTPADQNDLLRGHIDVDDSWCIQRSYGGGDGHRVYLEPPLTHPGCKSLVGGEKLIFYRSFNGMRNHRPAIELSQKLVHSLDIHHLPERHAYCRLDERGDIEDVITVFSDSAEEPYGYLKVVAISAKDLVEYMALSKQALVRKFDFTRVPPGGFSGWDGGQHSQPIAPDLFYNSALLPGRASYANGCQILRSSVTEEEIVERWKASLDTKNKKYETFKIQDWKNNRLVEISCAPEALSNYFVKSDKPFETSPAFFRPEVLQKYKADPDKYELQDRSITCRNAWHLQTYDINDAGQVHTYIIYLSSLPYEEQQYWRTFNEWPKEPISKRAFQTDFEGKWSLESDPLWDLKRTVADLDKRKPHW
jgi:hypothetical protein